MALSLSQSVPLRRGRRLHTAGCRADRRGQGDHDVQESEHPDPWHRREHELLCLPDNGKRYDIFGHGGAQRKAQELGAPFLGEVPINIQLRINGDEGRTGENYNVVDSAPYLSSCATGWSRT